MNSVKRGAFIVVEGADRCGKSTQCKNLVANLNKRDIKSELLNFPDRSTLTGKLISEYLSNKDCKLHDKAIHLLFSANRWENVDKIKSLLYDGVTLIVDRYSYSGIAYSAVKNDMDVNWCKQPENGLPKPDLVLLLTLGWEELAERPGFGKERYESVGIQKQVADMFLKLSKEDDNWDIVNVKGSVDQVTSQLMDKVLKVIEDVGTTPLQYLDFSCNGARMDNGS